MSGPRIIRQKKRQRKTKSETYTRARPGVVPVATHKSERPGLTQEEKIKIVVAPGNKLGV
jgi:hypothetical protein